MNVFKIAWRSIQHRGFGSFLTIVSMALGVMMVVAVLTIHGLVSESFKSNNSFGYNVLVGARGGGLQLTLNTVYYLSRPVENIPYEYYLAFCDDNTRSRELKNSIAYQARAAVTDTRMLTGASGLGGSAWGVALADEMTDAMFQQQQDVAMKLELPGLYRRYTHVAVPMCLGDSYVDPETGADFRCVGTKPNFFSDLVLDIDSEEKFKFAEGRCFVEDSPEHGFFECVVGATVANRCQLKVGDRIQATHGDPTSESAHIHDQNYTIVGIIEATGTPHDRVIFLNMEGFFLMEDHAKPVERDSVLNTDDRERAPKPDDGGPDAAAADPLEDDESPEDVLSQPFIVPDPGPPAETQPPAQVEDKADPAESTGRIPLPIEQREVTSILVRTSINDSEGVLGIFLPAQINEGDLETTLDWTPYRPERSQKAAQAVNPVMEVASLFQLIVDPIRWLLLALTSMICVVSALSIVVGIYNSMNQRQQEIAVMRALGANRGKVMMIMLCEAILLAVAGGMLGWIGGHGLNAMLSPTVEARTGVPIRFYDFAPPVELAYLPGAEWLPSWLVQWTISPEFLIIPALVLLAIVVGIYPAVSAYRTDVSKSLGK